ncbi:MAG: DUF6404 family protein [Pseudomonadota bacterium]
MGNRSYDERVAKAEAELVAAGINLSNGMPPVFRLMRAAGFQPRPPHYSSFNRIALSMGAPFGLLFGGVMWLVVWSDEGMPMPLVLAAVVLSGALFGFAMAYLTRRAAEKHGLSDWEEL